MSQVIETILSSHRPPLEEETLEYLKSLLGSLEEDDEDYSNVLEMLQEFLTTDECDAIARTWEKQASTQPQTHTKDVSHKPQALCLKGQLSTADQADDPTTETAPEKNASTETAISKKSKKEQRMERRQQKRKQNKPSSTSSPSEEEEAPELMDDHTSAWLDCKKEGTLWGGRARGGRGLRITGDNLENIHLPSVSVQFAGNELLVDSPVDFVKGHRYGLLGRNGVGKTTILKMLSRNAIPGMPRDMRIVFVQQQIQGKDGETALQALLKADMDRTELMAEQETVEHELEAGVNLETNAVRLGDIVAELDAIDADGAEDRALNMLKGLSFTKSMIDGPTSALSGGWRMRLSLAQALFKPRSDLLLLDEVTNHLDLHGLAWLIQYIQSNNHTILVVSHDRGFLDAICTDIIVMQHKRLTYHTGNYSEYQRQVSEKACRQSQLLDAAERQRTKALSFIQKNQKSNDPNKQRQAKMVKEKKLDRIGKHREDGKRYKDLSLKKMDMASARLSQKVHIEVDSPVLNMRFPKPTWPPSVSANSPLVQLEDVSFRYAPDNPALLQNITLNLNKGSKVALVGSNGSGKTTLVKLLTGEHAPTTHVAGTIHRNPHVRIGHVTQYSVEELEEYRAMTVVQYAEEKLARGKASSVVIKEASGNVRQYLGAFGLGGAHAHRKIAKLSGGERMRLCFATVMANEPHLLFLDESTNHVDLETLDAMSDALRDFEGAILMVSHNQGFLSGFCTDLWVVEDGRVQINSHNNDSMTFDEMFMDYRNSILSSSSATMRADQRRTKATMARRATKQSTGTKATASLLG